MIRVKKEELLHISKTKLPHPSTSRILRVWYTSKLEQRRRRRYRAVDLQAPASLEIWSSFRVPLLPASGKPAYRFSRHLIARHFQHLRTNRAAGVAQYSLHINTGYVFLHKWSPLLLAPFPKLTIIPQSPFFLWRHSFHNILPRTFLVLLYPAPRDNIRPIPLQSNLGR